MKVSITPEQYEALQASGNKSKTAYVLGLIDASDYYGYGVKDLTVRPSEIEYTTYDSCD